MQYYDGLLVSQHQYRSGDKRYMLVGPRMSIGSTIVPGSNGNTLVIPDRRRTDSGEVSERIERSFAQAQSRAPMRITNFRSFVELSVVLNWSSSFVEHQNQNQKSESERALLPTVHKGGEQSVSAELVLQKALDREKQPVIQLTLTAADGGNPPRSGTSQIIIKVLDINDNAPEFSRPLYKASLVENLSIGTTLIILNATDKDEGTNGEIVYSLRKTGQDHILDIFQIDPNTGAITVKGNIDFEENNAFEIRAQASDKGQPPMSTHCKVLVEVLDINDNEPEITVTSLLSTVKEDASFSTAVALVSVIDRDGGKNAVHKGGEQSVSAELVLQKALDREKQPVIQLTLTAVDGGTPSKTGTSLIIIKVLDINDNAPAFSKPLYKATVFENVAIGTTIVVLNATDFDEDAELISINGGDTFTRTQTLPNKEKTFPGQRFTLPNAFDLDVGVNSIKSYKLSPNEHFSLDVQSGGDQSVSAELVLQKALDREKQPVIQLTLTAVDGGKPPKSGTTQIIVNVVDVNDNIPVFDKPLYKARITENSPPGASVITVNAKDADEGLNGEVIYSFINHDNDDSVNAFSINPITGEITIKSPIDYEETAAIEIRVQAEDKGPNPRASHCKVLVEVIDVNDNVPEISVMSLVNEVREDSSPGTMVGLITVKDGDAGKNGVVQLKIKDAVQFRLENTYKNRYSLMVNGPLDRESASEYNVTITATDEGTPPLSSTSVITVHVSDVNDNAPRFPDPIINVYVKENSQIGAVIHTVSAFDPDLGDNARITYYLLESSKSGQ
ncbi:hypothetical protein cypCar_00031467, partial [Cyprinus carpio]